MVALLPHGRSHGMVVEPSVARYTTDQSTRPCSTQQLFSGRTIRCLLQIEARVITSPTYRTWPHGAATAYIEDSGEYCCDDDN
uniref:Uncharacterized protein n=1 Tax=Leersia perrieri TaxID=77586 RepID=A0A0D9V852_9ORYZ